MYLTSFRVADEVEKEAILDALLPLLPAGVHEDGSMLSVFSGVPFERSVMEAACGRALDGWTVEEVPGRLARAAGAARWGRGRRGRAGVDPLAVGSAAG